MWTKWTRWVRPLDPAYAVMISVFWTSMLLTVIVLVRS